jgi:RNA polymerase sigma factor (sigma-70 family)
MARSGGGANRVDRLDAETVRLVSRNLAVRPELRAGDAAYEQAWNRLHRACAPLMRKLASQRCCRCWSVEDRVQELWRVTLERLGSYDPERGPFANWLASLLRNALIVQDRYSHPLEQLNDETERLLPGRESEPANAFEQLDSRQDLANAAQEIRALVPEQTYRVIRAHWVERKDYEEIAATTGLTVKQVRDRHHRAVKKLREHPPRGA